MKPCVIIPSIRKSECFVSYATNFSKFGHRPDIIVIDEVDKLRDEIRRQTAVAITFPRTLQFFGIKERKQWFINNALGDVNEVIPQNCHNELSFGLLVAYQRNKYDMIVIVDDDTKPCDVDKDFLAEHWKRLHGSFSKWSSTFQSNHYRPRGFPYAQRVVKTTKWFKPKVVLNMGGWMGTPDLNAMDCLALEGRESHPVTFKDGMIFPRSYIPVCSMNLAFKPEVIPAFYQLWHKNRFEDIISGVILKRIADHLGVYFHIGYPLVYHFKAPRDLLSDVTKELPAIKLNEVLWELLDELKFIYGSFKHCYEEVALELRFIAKNNVGRVPDPPYVLAMAEKMLVWNKIIDKLDEQRKKEQASGEIKFEDSVRDGPSA